MQSNSSSPAKSDNIDEENANRVCYFFNFLSIVLIFDYILFIIIIILYLLYNVHMLIFHLLFHLIHLNFREFLLVYVKQA